MLLQFHEYERVLEARAVAYLNVQSSVQGSTKKATTSCKIHLPYNDVSMIFRFPSPSLSYQSC